MKDKRKRKLISKPSRTDLDMTKAWVTWTKVGFGITVYVLFVPDHVIPLGLVWGTFLGKTFHVFGSYVCTGCRRRGVRTKINKTIFQHAVIIQTSELSTRAGIAFMKASGYHLEKQLQVWWKRRV